MARAARAWVSLMLPAPINPMWITEDSTDRDERGVFALDPGRPRLLFEHDDAVAERRRLPWLQREVHGLASFTEDLLSERVGGEQPVAARVPVGREAGIPRMIDDRDRDLLRT